MENTLWVQVGQVHLPVGKELVNEKGGSRVEIGEGG